MPLTHYLARIHQFYNGFMLHASCFMLPHALGNLNKHFIVHFLPVHVITFPGMHREFISTVCFMCLHASGHLNKHFLLHLLPVGVITFPGMHKEYISTVFFMRLHASGHLNKHCFVHLLPVGVITFPGVHKEYISSLRWAGPNNVISSSYDGSIRLLDINQVCVPMCAVEQDLGEKEEREGLEKLRSSG
jgi:hypothetical protein